MKSRIRISYFLILLFFFGRPIICWGEKNDSLFLNHPGLFDSTSREKISPPAAGEEKLFADPDLHYKGGNQTKKDFFEKFIDWVADKLFGNTNGNHVQMARNILIWITVIICVILVIRIFLRSEISGLISSRSMSIKFNFSDITEELDKIDFTEKITGALKENDFRLAIRWHYLKTLHLLNKTGKINFESYKTNIDYINELRSEKILPEFKNLNRIYDHVWYGEYLLNEETYQGNSSFFIQFEKLLNV